jgi:dihydrolipoamide dehydrogenase
MYDLIVIGSGPGGYVAAIRASQLGMKVAVIEKAEIGGICLNWGCIPTKALLKSAQVYQYMLHAENYGIKAEGMIKPDFGKVIERSRSVAEGMSKGVQFLFKKNKIELIQGFGKILKPKAVEVTDKEGKKTIYEAEHIIIATGARSKEIPGMKQDGKHVIGYREALTLPKLPETMIIVGSGAIGSEFAYFYNAMGTKVTLIELLPNLAPLCDTEVSKLLGRAFTKSGIKVMTDTTVKNVEIKDGKCIATIQSKKGEEKQEADIVLSSVGITPNLEGIGIEEVGIEKEKDKIKVDEYYRTNIAGIYAIGDIVHGQALAHVASAEGIVCVEKIAGQNPEPINYSSVPECIYCTPEVASVGMTEEKAKEAGYEYKTGKFPYSASGKASAAGNKEGFVKLIIESKYGEILGAHFIGDNVTEMISEMVLAKKLEATGHEIMKAIHPHPTMSEAIMEAAANAYGETIHL